MTISRGEGNGKNCQGAEICPHLAADREIIEEWKWMGSPVWSRDGIIAVGNAHKEKVKLTFDHGARLADPDKLFNAGLEGNQRRAIDFFEGDKVNERALKNLVRAAVDYNQLKIEESACASASESKQKQEDMKLSLGESRLTRRARLSGICRLRA